MRPSGLAVGVVLGLCCAGCDATGAATACGSPADVNEVAGALARAYCHCDSTDLGGLALGHAPTDCVAELTAFFAEGTIGHLAASVRAGTATYRPEDLDDCLCPLATCDGARFERTCVRFGDGRVPDGGHCTRTEDCGPQSLCASGENCDGTCVHAPAVGDPCSTSSDCTSPAGGFDTMGCAAGACALLPEAGEPCLENRCALDAQCSSTMVGVPGTCLAPRAPLAEGASCADLSDACGADLVCVDAAQTCEPALHDGSCRAEYGYGGPHDCTWPDRCVGATQTANGTCTPPPGRGEACTWLQICAAGLRCIVTSSSLAGTCEPTHHLGEGCSVDAECIGGICLGGVCSVPPACHTAAP